MDVLLDSETPAGKPVVRPDAAEVAAVEQANENLSPAQPFENLETHAGDWRVEKDELIQADSSARNARVYIKEHRWMDCWIKAKMRIDSTDESADSPSVRLIVRGDDTTETFYTVGLFVGSREVCIEKSCGQ